MRREVLEFKEEGSVDGDQKMTNGGNKEYLKKKRRRDGG